MYSVGDKIPKIHRVLGASIKKNHRMNQSTIIISHTQQLKIIVPTYFSLSCWSLHNRSSILVGDLSFVGHIFGTILICYF